MAQSLVCNDCGLQLKSVKEATDHNEATGHADFAESVEKVIVDSGGVIEIIAAVSAATMEWLTFVRVSCRSSTWCARSAASPAETRRSRICTPSTRATPNL